MSAWQMLYLASSNRCKQLSMHGRPPQTGWPLKDLARFTRIKRAMVAKQLQQVTGKQKIGDSDDSSMTQELNFGWVTCLGVDTIVNQAALTLPLQEVVPQVGREAPESNSKRLVDTESTQRQRIMRCKLAYQFLLATIFCRPGNLNLARRRASSATTACVSLQRMDRRI